MSYNENLIITHIRIPLSQQEKNRKQWKQKRSNIERIIAVLFLLVNIHYKHLMLSIG